MPPNGGQGDVRLTRAGAWRMVLRKDEVEIGNSGSKPSNIAEGHSRRTRQAYLNHLSIALGSQSEVETQVELSRRLGLLSEETTKEILQLAEQVGRKLHALIRSLEEKGT